MTQRWPILLAVVLSSAACAAPPEATDDSPAAFSFAVFGSSAGEADRTTTPLLRAIEGSSARFVVHFDVSPPSPVSCSDASLAWRRTMLDASARPVVPVVAAAEWSSCGKATHDPFERLEHLGDVLFNSDESLGQQRLQWLRQSAMSRFKRYRENLRWQSGHVLFATINLPDNNNNFRIAAGRNGEFEERLLANRAWLDRTFRIAAERRAAGIVLFIDAAPRFDAAMRTPDLRTRERDGFYEWKLAFRDFVPAYKGQVLLVQGRYAKDVSQSVEVDRPLHDVSGRTIANFARVALTDTTGLRWLKVTVDPADPKLFRVTGERIFDDPSGELYGTSRRP